MKTIKEDLILSAVRKAEPRKKRVTFFISEISKTALAQWCNEHEITESSAIEEMIKATVPTRYFEKRR